MEGNRKRVTGARKYCRKGYMEILEWKLKEINRTIETERGKQKEGNRKRETKGRNKKRETKGRKQKEGNSRRETYGGSRWK